MEPAPVSREIETGVPLPVGVKVTGGMFEAAVSTVPSDLKVICQGAAGAAGDESAPGPNE